jgi:CO/xanthine dehydrogenase Mo-binding subunit
VRLTGCANLNSPMATVSPPMGTVNFVKNVQSNDATPLIEVATRCVITKTTPASAYRGAGRPEGNPFLEVTTPPTLEMGGIRVNADGTVTIVTGTLNDGQGHWTPFAQVLSGEAGCAGSLPAVMNVLIDALRPVGVTQIDMPAIPEKVWRAIRDARQAA